MHNSTTKFNYKRWNCLKWTHFQHIPNNAPLNVHPFYILVGIMTLVTEWVPTKITKWLKYICLLQLLRCDYIVDVLSITYYITDKIFTSTVNLLAYQSCPCVRQQCFRGATLLFFQSNLRCLYTKWRYWTQEIVPGQYCAWWEFS